MKISQLNEVLTEFLENWERYLSIEPINGGFIPNTKIEYNARLSLYNEGSVIDSILFNYKKQTDNEIRTLAKEHFDNITDDIKIVWLYTEKLLKGKTMDAKKLNEWEDDEDEDWEDDYYRAYPYCVQILKDDSVIDEFRYSDKETAKKVKEKKEQKYGKENVVLKFYYNSVDYDEIN